MVMGGTLAAFGSLTSVTHSRTVAAAENYTLGDVISNSATDTQGTPWQFANVGTQGFIRLASIVCSAGAVTARTRLHLFSASPTASELDDNVALALDNDDRANYLGYVDMPAMADMGEFAAAQAEVLMPYQTDAGTLYGVLEDKSGETNESAGMTVGITLHVQQA